MNESMNESMNQLTECFQNGISAVNDQNIFVAAMYHDHTLGQLLLARTLANKAQNENDNLQKQGSEQL